MITINDVKEARERIKSYVVKTPLLRVAALDEQFGCEVYIKPENLQITGSFKLRGATNKLLSLNEEQKKNGIVCASSGNHAQGCAYAAKLLGIDAVIVMPTDSNPVKLAGTRGYGATVVLAGTKSSEREAKMREYVESENRTVVHPYADDMIQAGQGTLALEVLEDVPDMDVFVVPIGGGGLMSGVAIAAKGTNPAIRIIGVEPTGAPRYAKSLEIGAPATLDSVNTIADGTRTDKANENNFEMLRKYVDEFVAVTDDEIRDAMKLAVAKAKIVVEPSSAMSIAAGSTHKYSVKANEKVCFVISGGNNDLDLLREVLA